MALNDNITTNINNKRLRTYNLCRICNLKGKKGNALVICTACTKHIHTSNSCSTRIFTSSSNNNNINNDEDDDDKIQYICNTCKAKRKSNGITAPTTHTISRRSNQSATTPSLNTTKHTKNHGPHLGHDYQKLR